VRRGKFCSRCAGFPCERLSRLDQRYRANYGMSMIENLAKIETEGLRSFLEAEQVKWACPGCGATLCVHQRACPACGRTWR
jgi:rubrerythrin